MPKKKEVIEEVLEEEVLQDEILREALELEEAVMESEEMLAAEANVISDASNDTLLNLANNMMMLEDPFDIPETLEELIEQLPDDTVQDGFTPGSVDSEDIVDLSPCPKCGGRADIIEVSQTDAMISNYSVGCVMCGLGSQGVISDEIIVNGRQKTFISGFDKAMEWWNGWGPEKCVTNEMCRFVRIDPNHDVFGLEQVLMERREVEMNRRS